MRLVVSAAARVDLKAIARYTRQKWSTAQAKTYLALIAERIVHLARRPRLGKKREDVAPGYRSLPVGRHLIFYRIDDNAVIVVRVLHQSMDLRLHL